MTSAPLKHSVGTTAAYMGDILADAMLLTDAAGTIVFLNDAFEILTGLERSMLFGQSLAGLTNSDSVNPLLSSLQAARQSGNPDSGSVILPATDGSEQIIRWRCIQQGEQTVLICRDEATHTARIQAGDEVRAYETIGRLVDGVAHDINNVTTVITTYADMIQFSAEPDSKSCQHSENILEAVERVSTLTRQLLSFGRQKRTHPTAINIQVHWESTVKLLRKLLPQNIALIKEPHPTGSVFIDPGYLDEIFLRLAAVARESLPNGGTVIVSTTITPNPELKDEPSPASDTGEFVQIRIIIEGAPASPPQIELPVIPAIEHIIQQHKGHIRVQPTSENRCELCLYLPRHLENHTTAPDHLSTEVHGHETVLLVEPDPAVRIASRMILENFGYHVLDADTGESALDRAATSNHTVQVLLTDACLADIGGPQLAAQLKARYPALKVLLMSAASDADLMRLQANVDDDVFIRKPFDARSLARHIRTVMDTKNQIPLEQSTVIT